VNVSESIGFLIDTMEKSVIPVNEMESKITRAELEKQIAELARKYVETHDPKIREKVYTLARELEEMEKGD